MQLTAFSDYTLRVLIYLGLRQDRLATISEIAGAYGISKNHLMKVVHHLATLGYIETTRGKGGGIKLKLPPDKINVGQVVRDSETDTALVECFEPDRSCCRITPACTLRGIFREALEAFFQILERYTLADLLQTQDRLAAILFHPPKARTRSTR